MNKYIPNPQNQKSNLTEKILELLPDNKKITPHQAKIAWWFNIRNNGGLRLTTHGFDLFKKTLEFESWEVNLSQDNTKFNQRILLQLDKSLSWPYFVDMRNKKIYFFSSREATLATLYGDVYTWISKNSRF